MLNEWQRASLGIVAFGLLLVGACSSSGTGSSASSGSSGASSGGGDAATGDSGTTDGSTAIGPGNCGSRYEPCAGDTCCQGFFCPIAGNGNYRCQPVCLAGGEQCGDEQIPCCNPNHRCDHTAACAICLVDGASCEYAADCCNRMCNATSKTCAPP